MYILKVSTHLEYNSNRLNDNFARLSSIFVILLGCQQSFGVFFKNFIFVFSLQKYNQFSDIYLPLLSTTYRQRSGRDVIPRS
jgi:hypothetical protein